MILLILLTPAGSVMQGMLNEDLMPDALHPNAAGLDGIASSLHPFLEQHLCLPPLHAQADAPPVRSPWKMDEIGHITATNDMLQESHPLSHALDQVDAGARPVLQQYGQNNTGKAGPAPNVSPT